MITNANWFSFVFIVHIVFAAESSCPAYWWYCLRRDPTDTARVRAIDNTNRSIAWTWDTGTGRWDVNYKHSFSTGFFQMVACFTKFVDNRPSCVSYSPTGSWIGDPNQISATGWNMNYNGDKFGFEPISSGQYIFHIYSRDLHYNPWTVTGGLRKPSPFSEWLDDERDNGKPSPLQSCNCNGGGYNNPSPIQTCNCNEGYYEPSPVNTCSCSANYINPSPINTCNCYGGNSNPTPINTCNCNGGYNNPTPNNNCNCNPSYNPTPINTCNCNPPSINTCNCNQGAVTPPPNQQEPGHCVPSNIDRSQGNGWWMERNIGVRCPLYVNRADLQSPMEYSWNAPTGSWKIAYSWDRDSVNCTVDYTPAGGSPSRIIEWNYKKNQLLLYYNSVPVKIYRECPWKLSINGGETFGFSPSSDGSWVFNIYSRNVVLKPFERASGTLNLQYKS